MEVEPLDPAQRSVYADPKNLYYPRGQEELNNGPPAPHCPRCGTLLVAAQEVPVELAGGHVAWSTRWQCPKCCACQSPRP